MEWVSFLLGTLCGIVVCTIVVLFLANERIIRDMIKSVERKN